MHRAVYPGSFDPVTNGHLDVIERASRLYDEVIVAIAHNEAKAGLFSFDERVALLKEAVEHHPNVRVTQFDGLLVNYALEVNARVIIRGLRAVSDFEYEFQMALMNRKLVGEVETMFLMPKEEYSYVSSRLVKEIARLGGNIESFVPDCIVRALREKFSKNNPRLTP
ncbi:MAG: pantetheine-phosphate adenylyltransferase [Verrucomicrobia bacterium]|nr:pantetheine-phosphate adenylyltransferase [Verrucomicrobiota bacterium]